MALSAAAMARLQAHIDKEARLWAENYIAQRKQWLARRRINASGDLINSLAYDTEQALQGAVTNVLYLAFESHGRFVDMRRLRPAAGGTEYIAAITDWIQRKGLWQRYQPQYMSRRNLVKPPSQETMLQNMAWAVVRRRAERYRRRAWYAKSSAAAVTDLYNRVAAGLPDIVLQELQRQFK